VRHDSVFPPSPSFIFIAMNSFRRELWFEIPRRRQFLNITAEVAECVRASAVQEGLALVNAMHITASVFINDDERGLHRDLEAWLERLAPELPHANTTTTAPKTTRTRISSAPSWDAKSWSR
jgi:thiamine phosphate synthase YjbQ (UPF0047 family)